MQFESCQNMNYIAGRIPYFEEFLILKKMRAPTILKLYLPICSYPPVDVIKDLLSSVERVTFYGFLIGLAKHAGVNESIGKVDAL